MSFFQITIAETQLSFPCHYDETVLTAMFRLPMAPLHHGCCGGGCGICKMKIIAGTYVKFKRMSQAHVSPAEEANGIVLLCCIKPRSNLIISKWKGE